MIYRKYIADILDISLATAKDVDIVHCKDGRISYINNRHEIHIYIFEMSRI